MTPDPTNNLVTNRDIPQTAMFPTLRHTSRIVDRARNGDSAAFDILFNTHKDAIYRLLWHLLDGDKERVEEAVGAVFLSAYRAMGKFRGDAAFETWLYRIAVRESSVHRRQRHKEISFRESLVSLSEQVLATWGLGKQPQEPADTNDPLHTLLQNEQNQQLHIALQRLPEPYRTPIILRYLSGKENSEIATVLQRPQGTVRYQISRGLKLLAERLESGWNP